MLDRQQQHVLTVHDKVKGLRDRHK